MRRISQQVSALIDSDCGRKCSTYGFIGTGLTQKSEDTDVVGAVAESSDGSGATEGSSDIGSDAESGDENEKGTENEEQSMVQEHDMGDNGKPLAQSTTTNTGATRKRQYSIDALGPI